MRLVTWNVLADAYVVPDRYRSVSPRLLEPAARRRAVLARAQGLDADVLCLQEVEADAFAALVALPGLTGTFERKGRGRPDGCAVLWRGARLLGRDALAFDDGETGDELPSGHVALRVRLDTLLGPVDVITTHLRWSSPRTPRASRVTARQADELAAWLAPAPTVSVLCGDLNVEPRDEVLQRLLASGLKDVHGGHPTPATAVIDGRARKIDHVLLRGAWPARPGLAVDLTGRLALPDEQEPSDHVPLVVELG